MVDNATQAPNGSLTLREKLTDEAINEALHLITIVLPDWHVSYQRTDRGSVRVVIDGPDGRRKVVSPNP